ncbi:MAG: hypothetical protein QOF78_3019 [Phycisphaerales bacterium]|jgi:hypothetical protein|nr:hypothetical protein [Phycisphaerales bacterium]
MAAKRKSLRKARTTDDCTFPPPIAVSDLRAIAASISDDLTFGKAKHEGRRVRAYVEREVRGEKVTYLERVGEESLLGRIMGFWSVHTNKGKWWVITNPTNLYAQDTFPSLDYAVSLHVGVTTRMYARDRTYEGNDRVKRVTPTLKRLEAAGEALDKADEPEKFQAVGMALRECLLTLTRALASSKYVPEGQEPPKHADFIHWSELIADAVAHGERSQHVRAYLKTTAKTAWQLVNWLTHTSSAVRHDAQLAHGAVEAVVGCFWRAAEKHEAGTPDKCPACGSYKVAPDYRPDLELDPPYVLVCERCDAFFVKQTAAPQGATEAVPKTRQPRKK